MKNDWTLIDYSFLDLSALVASWVKGKMTYDWIVFNTILESQIAVELSLKSNLAESRVSNLN
jgi:hypothetical protein